MPIEPARHRRDHAERERIERDRQQRARQDQVASLGRQQPERDAEPGEDERELADLREARGNRQRRAHRVAEHEHDREGSERFADHDHEQHADQLQRPFQHDRWIEQHADGDEEHHGERILQRQRVLRGLMTQLGLGEHDACEERTEREGDVEQMRGPVRDAERDRQYGESEQLARAGARDVVQDPRHDASAADEHERHEHRDLERRHPKSGQQRARISGAVGRERGQEHQREDRCEVFDDQPAHCDVAVLRVELVALLERAQQHDRACDRESETEYEPGRQIPAPPARESCADHGGDGDLRHCAGQRDGAHAQQCGNREMQADAEHQQDDADLGQLRGEIGIGDESRRERTDRDARDQVADERRQAHACGEVSKGEREHEADGDQRDEFGFVGHGATVARSRAEARPTGGSLAFAFL